MVSSRSAIAVRTASAGSQIRGRSEGSTTFIRGCAKGFSASLASPISAADLTATLARSNARSPAWHFPPLLWMFHKAVCNLHEHNRHYAGAPKDIDPLEFREQLLGFYIVFPETTSWSFRRQIPRRAEFVDVWDVACHSVKACHQA